MKHQTDTLLSFAPDMTGEILFLNAQYAPSLETYSERITCVQSFYPFAKTLEQQGFRMEPDFPDTSHDHALLLGSKSLDEMRDHLARCANLLPEGAILTAAAGNKEGGTRLKSLLDEYGFEITSSDSKNKMKIIQARRNAQDIKPPAALTSILDGAYVSRPGLFGWNKIDQGSQILLDFIPDNLDGKVADFGCGYGYLSTELVKKCKNIKEIVGIDADYRAKICFKDNLKGKGIDFEFIWQDLEVFRNFSTPFKTILMNPPFHQHKQTDMTIGQNFIRTAAHALRPGGTLYMVANAHLPYEHILEDRFASHEKLYEGRGFKIFAAKA